MDKIYPENAPGFLVDQIAHRLKFHIRKFLTDASIQLTAEELTILTALAYLDSAKINLKIHVTPYFRSISMKIFMV